MKKILLALFIVSLFGQIEVKIKDLITISSITESKKEYIFFAPEKIEVDNMGNIYVKDQKEQFIRKYDQNGKYLTNIGKLGKGPGEFIEITAWTTKNNEIIIYDRSKLRLTSYDLEGKNYKDISFGQENKRKEILNMIEFGEGIITDELNVFEKYSPPMYCFYDKNNKKMLNIKNPITTKYQDYLTNYIQGETKFIINNNDIIVSPRYYEGKLYKLNYKKNWEVYEFKREKIKKAYEIIIDPSLEDVTKKYFKKGYSICSTYDKRFVIEYFYKNKGLAVFKDKYILQFYLHLNSKKENVYFLDIFTLDGKFIETINIKEYIIGEVFKIKNDIMYWKTYDDGFPIIKKSKLEITGI